MGAGQQRAQPQQRDFVEDESWVGWHGGQPFDRRFASSCRCRSLSRRVATSAALAAPRISISPVEELVHSRPGDRDGVERLRCRPSLALCECRPSPHRVGSAVDPEPRALDITPVPRLSAAWRGGIRRPMSYLRECQRDSSPDSSALLRHRPFRTVRRIRQQQAVHNSRRLTVGDHDHHGRLAQVALYRDGVFQIGAPADAQSCAAMCAVEQCDRKWGPQPPTRNAAPSTVVFQGQSLLRHAERFDTSTCMQLREHCP